MRVRFPRLADHQPGYSVIERDDGVVYRMDGTIMGRKLPHDLRHLIVERELRVSDGLFGAIAAGTVWHSMHHVRGRRPPHAADRSEELKRTQRERIGLAGLLADLIEDVAALDDPSPEEIGRLTERRLSTVPVTEPGMTPADVIGLPPPEVLASAARALQVETARWARLRVGDELAYEWPPSTWPGVRALRSVPGPSVPKPRNGDKDRLRERP